MIYSTFFFFGIVLDIFSNNMSDALGNFFPLGNEE